MESTKEKEKYINFFFVKLGSFVKIVQFFVIETIL